MLEESLIDLIEKNKIMLLCEKHNSFPIISFCPVEGCYELLCPVCEKTHAHKNTQLLGEFSEKLYTAIKLANDPTLGIHLNPASKKIA